MEQFARDKEGLLHKKNGQLQGSTPLFGGAADTRQQGKPLARYACTKCGEKNCKWLKTRKSEDCPGSKATCQYCKRPGHLEKACFTKRKDTHKRTAAGAEACNGDIGTDVSIDEDMVNGYSGVSLSQPFF